MNLASQRLAIQASRLQCRIARSLRGRPGFAQRWKASSALPDLSEFVRESVKTTILNEAARDDSRLWRKELNTVKTVNGFTNGHVDLSTSTVMACDPLDDLYLTDATRYWPGLPLDVGMADPFTLAQTELSRLAASIREDLIGTDHPVLNQAAAYFFDSAGDGGKKVRPMMVLLLSRALADSAAAAASTSSMLESPPMFEPDSLFTAPLPWQRQDLPAAQRRLAEISEMIHTASLFHDDVIDGADTRRGVPAVHMVFGNKMAILAGDYLLARASICLARLRHVEVVETMSTIIEHLVRGEVMQLRGSTASERSSERLSYYLRKNFYKTGSLMANSCKSAALLGDYPPELVDVSYRFGKHVGMAFQLVDDVLDFEGTLSQLGKPALSDLKAGLATAPVLFAAEECPELEPLIDRKFKDDGDVDRAVDLVFMSSGMERTKELARVHAEYAMDALMALRPSENRDALVHLANKVVARTK
jgi:geranylgeranyl pyrophosphate synthase